MVNKTNILNDNANFDLATIDKPLILEPVHVVICINVIIYGNPVILTACLSLSKQKYIYSVLQLSFWSIYNQVFSLKKLSKMNVPLILSLVWLCFMADQPLLVI